MSTEELANIDTDDRVLDTEEFQTNEEHEAEPEDEDEEELITAQKVLQVLETAWRNEINAPDILPHQNEMLDLMLGQLAHMEENLSSLENNDLRFVVHRMELERIRYLIASYLRCRLRKIENYSQHILNEDSQQGINDKKLSPEETIFAKEYTEMVEEHLKIMALQYMPNIQRSEAEQRIVRPNLSSHVFVKTNITVPAAVVGVDDEEIDLTAGSQHIVPYHLVAELVQNQQAQLL